MCAVQGRPRSTKTHKASLLNPNVQSGVYAAGIFVNPRYRRGISHVSNMKFHHSGYIKLLFQHGNKFWSW